MTWTGAELKHTVRPMLDKDKMLNPKSEDWGPIQHPLEILSYPLREAGAARETLAPRLFEWPAFVLLLLSAGAHMACEVVVLRALRFVRRWKHRIRVVSEAVRGQPVTSWPGVLRSLWVQRGLRVRERE